MTVIDYDIHEQRKSAAITGAAKDVTIACNTALDTTARILREGFQVGSVHVPAGSSITTITWYGTNLESLPGVPGRDEDHAPVLQTVAADEICQIPSAAMSFKYILPVTNAAGTLHAHFER